MDTASREAECAARPIPRAILIIFLLGVGIRLLPLAVPFEFSGPDSQSYVDPAWNLANEGTYTPADRPPGYPALLATVFWVVGEPSFLAVRLLQAVLGGLACALVCAVLLSREHPRLAIAGGVLAAIDPIAVGQSPFILRECLLLTLLTGLLASLTLLQGRRRVLVSGLLLMTLTLTHQLYVLLIGFLILGDAAHFRRRLLGRRLLPWIAMALLVILALFLWARRTERATGRLSMTATPNAVPARELWLTSIYSNDWLSGDLDTGFQARAFAEERRLVDELGVEGAKSELYARAWANWRDHPVRSLGRLLRLNFWYWVEIPGAVRLARHPQLWVVRWLLLPFHWLRLALAAAGVWMVLRDGRWRRYRHALTIVLFLGLAPALLYPVPRYLGPGVPILDLLAVLGGQGLLLRARSSEAGGD